MLMNTLLSIVLMLDPPPPAELPPALEICILKAELCAGVAFECGELDEAAMQACISDYEDCSYAFDEAHETSCQLERVWCALEAPYSIHLGINKDFIEFCSAVWAVCPSWG